MFNLRFTGETYRNEYGEFYEGEIIADDLREKFAASSTALTRSDYERLWSEQMEKLEDGKPLTFIVSADTWNPGELDYVEIWVLHPFDDEFKLQNRLVFANQLMGIGSLADVSCLSSDFSECNEDGVAISTWDVKHDDLQTFRERLRAVQQERQ